MIPTIIGLLAVPLDADEQRAGLTGKRAGILFVHPASHPCGRPGAPRFLDLDTLDPEPIAPERVAAGRLFPLDRRHARLLAAGLEKARRRLRAQHAVFAGALSEQVGQALVAHPLPATTTTGPAVLPAGSPDESRAARGGAAQPAGKPGGPRRGRHPLDEPAPVGAARPR